MKRKKIKIGDIYHKLTLVEEIFGEKRRFFKTKCECGNQTISALSKLTNGSTKSCGCYSRKKFGERAKTHGLTESSEYKTWCTMKQRCTNPNSDMYYRYGKRGITISPEWNEFETFYKDMGKRPTPKHSIDRINNDGNYCKENCRWATLQQQVRSKSNRIWINGFSIQEISKKYKIKQPTIKRRYHGGWTYEEIISNIPNNRHSN